MLAPPSNLYAQQKAVAQLNVGILQEIAWVAAEREFYNAEGLFDSVDGVWRLKRRVISEQVAALIGSFPNCGPHNPQTYAGMLTNEIAAADPDAITLEATCRIVRRTKNFAPTIAEVLEILKEQSSAVSDMAEADELKNWKHCSRSRPKPNIGEKFSNCSFSMLVRVNRPHDSRQAARNQRYAQRRRGLAPRAGAQKGTSDASIRSSANDALRP